MRDGGTPFLLRPLRRHLNWGTNAKVVHEYQYQWVARYLPLYNLQNLLTVPVGTYRSAISGTLSVVFGTQVPVYLICMHTRVPRCKQIYKLSRSAMLIHRTFQFLARNDAEI